MKKILLAVAIWTAFNFAGCSHDLQTEEEKTGPEVRFNAAIYDIDRPYPLADTRGVPITDPSKVPSMGVFACEAADAPDFMYNQLVTNTSGTWSYSPKKHITEGAFVDFYAYSPFAKGTYKASTNPAGNGIEILSGNTSAGVPRLRYTVPAACANQPDLMVALPVANKSAANGSVSFSMRHALTCVGFQLTGQGQRVVSIAIRGVSTTGTLKVDGTHIAWSDLDDPAANVSTGFSPGINYDQGQTYYTATPSPSTDLIPGDGYLMMIPQELTASAKLVVSLAGGTVQEFDLDGQPDWTPGGRILYRISLTPPLVLTISPTTLIFPAVATYAGAGDITVTSSTLTTGDWTLTSPVSWLRLGLSPNGTDQRQTVSGRGSAIVYTFVDDNSAMGSVTRTTTITGTQSIAVIQFGAATAPTGGGTPPAGVTTYVGAFWRASETGERLIRIPVGVDPGNQGPWMATVYWMDARWQANDIVLDATKANLPAYPAGFIAGGGDTPQVAGNSKSVTGNITSTTFGEPDNCIYFRIGLKSRFTQAAGYGPRPNYQSTFPARYAMVTITYGTPAKTQILYLRQGEDPDYVMRPSDPAGPKGNYQPASRSYAVPFSPYNLTAAVMTAGGTSVANHPKLALNGAIFTRYPTQAGAFFQWATPNNFGQMNRAFHPVSPLSAFTSISTASSTSAWYYNSSGFPGYWNNFYTSQELCPRGYTLCDGSSKASFRRPHDGSTTVGFGPIASLAYAERWQSLFYDMNNSFMGNSDNSLWGYYADGFFDRGALNTTAYGESGTVRTSVSWQNSEVAYAGYLFFNPRSSASLFFPAAGYRIGTTGQLTNAGLRTYYWSTSSSSERISWFLCLQNSVPLFSSTSRCDGCSVRCVREES